MEPLGVSIPLVGNNHLDGLLFEKTKLSNLNIFECFYEVNLVLGLYLLHVYIIELHFKLLIFVFLILTAGRWLTFILES